MRQSRKILVTGATGAQGGAAVDALLESGFLVRALVRDPQSRSAQALADRGVELAEGDFDAPVSLAGAVTGVQSVFSVQLPPPAHDPDLEVRTGRYLVEAASAAGVETFVHTSVARADDQETFSGWDAGLWSKTYWDSKSAVNELVRNAGFRHWTILKPAFMMDNFIMPKAQWMFPSLAQGEIHTAMDEQTRLDLIAAQDVGRFAAAAFADPARFHQQEIALAAESLTMAEVAQVVARISGKRVSAHFLSEPEMLATGANPGLVSSQRWANVEGYAVDIPAAASWGLRLTTLEDWLKAHADRLKVDPR